MRKRLNRQIDAQMAGFNLAKPTLEQMYTGAGKLSLMPLLWVHLEAPM